MCSLYLSYALLLLTCGAASDAVPGCTDAEETCGAWAAEGECFRNPGYMHVACRRSCLPECGASPRREHWEAEDLEAAWPNSMVVDVTGASLEQLLRSRGFDEPVVVWFFAPWCKQCKLTRQGYEEAARAAPVGVVFTRLDCVADVRAKERYGITSYPSFKIFRRLRHRWLEVHKDRTAAAFAAALEAEVAGPVSWIDTPAELEAAMYPPTPVPAKGGGGGINLGGLGRGEAVAVAAFAPAGGADAMLETAYGHLASGCSVRFSPLVFAATRNGSLLALVGLPPLLPGELAVIKLFSEPSDSPPAETRTPRATVLSLQPLLRTLDAVQLGEAERETCNVIMGERLPLLVDADVDPAWGKRAASWGFLKLHALLFLSPPHRELGGVVRAAAARFRRGSLVVMQYTVEGMDAGKNAMMPRFGVHSLLDTPRLVFLDQRVPRGDNRQLVYPGLVTEQGVVDFLLQEGLGPEMLQDERAAAFKSDVDDAAVKEEL